MKIIDIQTFAVNVGDGNHVFVKVLSDEHLHGVGEAYRVGPDDATEKTIHYFKEWVLGEDPMRIEHIWRILYNGSRFPGGSVINSAISGIELALWDLKGKALGVPVYELIGGRCRDKIRVYRGAGGGTPQQTYDSVRQAADEGFTAIKMSPMPPEWSKKTWHRTLKECDALMAAARKAAGDDMDIALDPHAQIFEPIRAEQMAEVLKPYHPLFYEEPLRPENIEAMGRLKQRIGIPLATGEMLYTKYEFRDVLAADAADIVQPDLLICGGLMEAKKIAAMAEAHYVDVAPHNPLGPVSTAVSAQFAASTPNFLILEYRVDSSGPMRDLILEPLKFVDGYLEIPDKPGWGIELNEKIFADHPMTTWRRPLVTEADGNVMYQ